MTDQIQTQQSSGESKLPWFNSLGNPWSVSFPIGPGQDPMIPTDAYGKAKGAVQRQGVSLSTCCSGAFYPHKQGEVSKAPIWCTKLKGCPQTQLPRYYFNAIFFEN